MFNVFKLIYSDWKRYTDLHKKLNPLIFPIILFRNPGMHFSVLYRIEFYLLHHPFILFKILSGIFYPFYFIYTYFILDIDISPYVKIGGGLYIHNKGIIFTDSVIAGNNLTIIGPATLGLKNFINDPPQGPKLGNNIKIFTGARLIGNINIADNVEIGANAVVVKNVASNCVVGGVPAKLIKKLNVSKLS